MIVEYDSCHGCGPFRSTFQVVSISEKQMTLEPDCCEREHC